MHGRDAIPRSVLEPGSCAYCGDDDHAEALQTAEYCLERLQEKLGRTKRALCIVQQAAMRRRALMQRASETHRESIACLEALIAQLQLSPDIVEQLDDLEGDADDEDRRTLRENKVLSAIYARWRGKLSNKADVEAMMREVYASEELSHFTKNNFELVVHQRYKMKW